MEMMLGGGRGEKEEVIMMMLQSPFCFPFTIPKH
jgi:hypothetical protein